MRSSKTKLTAVVALAGLSAIAPSVGAQGQMTSMDKAPMQHMDKGKGRPEPPATIRITMDDLHKQGGVPRGWKFLMPMGDAAEGRKVFVAMEWTSSLMRSLGPRGLAR